MGDHPWRRLRQLTDWLIGWAPLPENIWGLTDHDARVIVLGDGLTQAQRRCTLAHELEHVRRGPVPDDPILAAREEAAIDEAVSRRMIALDELGEALAWAHNPVEAADELWVDLPTLEARLRTLDPAEHTYLANRLEHAPCPLSHPED